MRRGLLLLLDSLAVPGCASPSQMPIPRPWREPGRARGPLARFWHPWQPWQQGEREGQLAHLSPGARAPGLEAPPLAARRRMSCMMGCASSGPPTSCAVPTSCHVSSSTLLLGTKRSPGCREPARRPSTERTDPACAERRDPPRGDAEKDLLPSAQLSKHRNGTGARRCMHCACSVHREPGVTARSARGQTRGVARSLHQGPPAAAPNTLCCSWLAEPLLHGASRCSCFSAAPFAAQRPQSKLAQALSRKNEEQRGRC